jgi:hypothetical protein
MTNPWMDKPGPLAEFAAEMLEESDRRINAAVARIRRDVEAAATQAGEAKGDIRLALAAVKAIERANGEAKREIHALADCGNDVAARVEGLGDRLTALESKPRSRAKKTGVSTEKATGS